MQSDFSKILVHFQKNYVRFFSSKMRQNNKLERCIESNKNKTALAYIGKYDRSMPSLKNLKNMVSKKWEHVDQPIIFSVLGLVAIGIVFSFSASPIAAERYGLDDAFYYTKRHLTYLGLFTVIFFGLIFVPSKFIGKWATPFFVLTLGLMFATLLFGDRINGARRWLDLIIFNLQASELIKPAFILFACKMASQAHDPENLPAIPLIIGSYSVSIALLLLQPDLGQTFILSVMFLTILFLVGLSWRYYLLIFGGFFLLALVTINIFSHVKTRINLFLNPGSGDNYQVDKALEMVKSGGWFGQGLGEGRLKFQLPDAHTDFIMAVAAEEFGLISIIIVLSLYTIIVYRLIAQAAKLRHLFDRLVVTLLSTCFGIQILIHLSVTLQLVPPKGMALPLISYGGSSLIGTAILLGIAASLLKNEQFMQVKPPA